MIELKFVNSDARPKTTVLQVSAASIAPIMAWYGAYYAGDRYAVYADGEKVPKDLNGEIADEGRGSRMNIDQMMSAVLDRALIASFDSVDPPIILPNAPYLLSHDGDRMKVEAIALDEFYLPPDSPSKRKR